jgi:hypothetical protein
MKINTKYHCINFFLCQKLSSWSQSWIFSRVVSVYLQLPSAQYESPLAPKCNVSFKVCIQLWTEFFIFRAGLARVYCIYLSFLPPFPMFICTLMGPVFLVLCASAPHVVAKVGWKINCFVRICCEQQRYSSQLKEQKSAYMTLTYFLYRLKFFIFICVYRPKLCTHNRCLVGFL